MADAAALLQVLQGHIEDVRNLLYCGVCARPMYEPFTLCCGHTFCYTCLTEWFTKNRRRKTCPECRAVVRSQPGPAYLVRDIVHYWTAQPHLLGPDETLAEHASARREELDCVEADKACADPRQGGLFRGCFGRGGRDSDSYASSPIRDLEDGVLRCPRCTHELEDGRCFQCGYTTYDNEGEGNEDEDEDEDFDDEDEDLDVDDEDYDDYTGNLIDLDVEEVPAPQGYYELDWSGPFPPLQAQQMRRAGGRGIWPRRRGGLLSGRAGSDDDYGSGPDADEEDYDDDDDSEMDDFIVHTDTTTGEQPFGSTYTDRPSGEDDDDDEDIDLDDDSDVLPVASRARRRTHPPTVTASTGPLPPPRRQHEVQSLITSSDNDDDDDDDTDDAPRRRRARRRQQVVELSDSDEDGADDTSRPAAAPTDRRPVDTEALVAAHAVQEARRNDRRLSAVLEASVLSDSDNESVASNAIDRRKRAGADAAFAQEMYAEAQAGASPARRTLRRQQRRRRRRREQGSDGSTNGSHDDGGGEGSEGEEGEEGEHGSPGPLAHRSLRRGRGRSGTDSSTGDDTPSAVPRRGRGRIVWDDDDDEEEDAAEGGRGGCDAHDHDHDHDHDADTDTQRPGSAACPVPIPSETFAGDHAGSSQSRGLDAGAPSGFGETRARRFRSSQTIPDSDTEGELS